MIPYFFSSNLVAKVLLETGRGLDVETGNRFSNFGEDPKMTNRTVTHLRNSIIGFRLVGTDELNRVS